MVVHPVDLDGHLGARSPRRPPRYQLSEVQGEGESERAVRVEALPVAHGLDREAAELGQAAYVEHVALKWIKNKRKSVYGPASKTTVLLYVV